MKLKQTILKLVVAASLTAFSNARETMGTRDENVVIDEDSVHYIINNDNSTLTLEYPYWDTNGWIGDFEIPEAVIVNGVKLPVTAIGNEAFSGGNSRNISGHVTIPSSVLQIGSRAFRYNKMTGIDIPETVTSIGSECFMECSNLSSIRIPAKVKIIEDSTFWNCTSLTTINLNNVITTIKDFAFSGCSSLKTIVFPSSLSFIGYEAFSVCYNLDTIAFKGAIPQINYEAESCFDNGSNTQLITVICSPDQEFQREFGNKGVFLITYSTPYATFEKSNGIDMANRSRLSFGNVAVGSKGKILAVRLKNNGNKALRLGKPTLNGPQKESFAIVSKVPSSIAPGRSVTLKIRFRPLVKTSLKSTFSMRCNDPTKRTLQLKLAGKGG